MALEKERLKIEEIKKLNLQTCPVWKDSTSSSVGGEQSYHQSWPYFYYNVIISSYDNGILDILDISVMA